MKIAPNYLVATCAFAGTLLLAVSGHSLLWGFWQALDGPSPHGSPQLVLRQTEFDLGVVEPGALHYRPLTIANTGDQRLVVHQTASGCDCSEGQSAEPVLVVPGESVTTRAVFKAPHRSGPVIQHVVFQTNDPSRPQLTIVLRAVVR